MPAHDSGPSRELLRVHVAELLPFGHEVADVPWGRSALKGEGPPSASEPKLRHIRDIETIDWELRLLARAWRVARQLTGRTPSTALIDEPLDERSAATARTCE